LAAAPVELDKHSLLENLHSFVYLGPEFFNFKQVFSPLFCTFNLSVLGLAHLVHFKVVFDNGWAQRHIVGLKSKLAGSQRLIPTKEVDHL